MKKMKLWVSDRTLPLPTGQDTVLSDILFAYDHGTFDHEDELPDLEEPEDWDDIEDEW